MSTLIQGKCRPEKRDDHQIRGRRRTAYNIPCLGSDALVPENKSLLRRKNPEKTVAMRCFEEFRRKFLFPIKMAQSMIRDFKMHKIKNYKYREL